MTDQGTQKHFVEFYNRHLGSDFEYLLEKRPKFAHYTSMGNFENIIKTEQLWFSNPLMMNDLQEMQYGLNVAQTIFYSSDSVAKACGNEIIYDKICKLYSAYYTNFLVQESMDVYVLCLSEHDPDHKDGILSMWRGYGAQGNGVAIVFNADFVRVDGESILTISRVNYHSARQREQKILNILEDWCNTVKNLNIGYNELQIPTYYLFKLFLLEALTTKHHGFSEEKEWRIIYVPSDDHASLLKNYFNYNIGPNGIEPKLKLPIKPLPDNPEATWTFATIVENIIIGPRASSPLAYSSVKRMLELLNKPEFVQKLQTSSIPLRPI